MENSEIQLKDFSPFKVENENGFLISTLNSSNLSSLKNENKPTVFSHFINIDKIEKINKSEYNDNIFFSHFINLEKIDTNYFIREETINENRIEYLDNKVSPLLISYMKDEDFEFGQKSESIRLVESQLKINKAATLKWFNQLYVKYFASDIVIFIGLLRIAEYLNEDLNPLCQTMALASLSHQSNEVKELGIRILEASCTIENYNILKTIKVDTKWMQDYIKQVIIDFEKELCLS